MILVFGTICLDRLRRVPKLPNVGGYVDVLDEAVYLGGEAANTASALSAWGGKVVLAGNGFGEGPDADLLKALLEEKGLQNQAISNAPESQKLRAPVCDIFVTPDGERTMFGQGFADMTVELALEELPFVSGSWFTAEPNMPRAAREATRLALDAGMKTYLMDFLVEDDPIAPGSVWQSSTDWAGFRGNTQKNVRWVESWVSRFGCFTILSDGPNGFVAGSPDLPTRSFPPYPAPEVVDTTGAGDLFRAGMLLGLDAGWPISRTLQFAAAAGCLKCKSLGATTNIPTIAEIEAHVEAYSEVTRHYL